MSIPILTDVDAQLLHSSVNTDLPAPERQGKIILTPKETEVLQWSARGKSSWEIGRILNCTEATANYHFSHIRRKFSVSSRGMAVLKALEQGLISWN